MASIYLPPFARRALRRWLSGRGRIKAIDRLRYVQMTTEQADTITYGELASIVDCTGYGVIDALIGIEA